MQDQTEVMLFVPSRSEDEAQCRPRRRQGGSGPPSPGTGSDRPALPTDSIVGECSIVGWILSVYVAADGFKNGVAVSLFLRQEAFESPSLVRPRPFLFARPECRSGRSRRRGAPPRSPLPRHQSHDRGRSCPAVVVMIADHDHGRIGSPPWSWLVVGNDRDRASGHDRTPRRRGCGHANDRDHARLLRPPRLPLRRRARRSSGDRRTAGSRPTSPLRRRT